MKEIVRQVAEALQQADGQMRMAAECIEAGRHDEALMHVQAMASSRAKAVAAAQGLESAALSLERELQRGREARVRASGMAGLLSEILGKGALSAYGDGDLVERVEMAVGDQEAASEAAAKAAG